MSKKNEIKGNCACGNVKYKIEGNPLFTQACHCKNCKLSTGSSFVIHTMVMEEDFKISGDVASIDLPTGSGKGYNAYFCIICGVYVFCRYNISKGRIAVRTQTLEKPMNHKHIFLLKVKILGLKLMTRKFAIMKCMIEKKLGQRTVWIELNEN